MVAAGVFLLGRTYPMLSPEVLSVITAVGALTALFAATIGTTVFDIKGVLAYSTISQLGFMVAGIGTGGLGLVAGLFHMVTHAFFKACLFLCAGSVIHGCHHEQDMRRMGGLWRKMPITAWCMFLCTLAIAGIPLFSGFYSKDRILQAAFLGASTFDGASVFAAVALPIAAALTAFYMFRLILMTFIVAPKDHHVHDHAHESPATMTTSLVVLAALGVLGGKVWLLDFDFLAHHAPWFVHMVSPATMYPGVTLMNVQEFSEHSVHVAHNAALGVSLFVALGGIAVAFWVYYFRRIDPRRITTALGEIYTAVASKYYVDELYNATVIRSTMLLSRWQRWIDENVVDGAVNGMGRLNRGLGFFSAWIDRTIVDGAVNAVGAVTQVFGSLVRLLQTGRIQQYVSFAVGGALLAAAWLLLL